MVATKMSVLGTIFACVAFVLQFHSCGGEEQLTECIQRDKNTREISKYLFCEEGCCGNELTYQYCCEMLNPDKMYTQYDFKKGLSPIHYFLIAVGGLLLVAVSLSIGFCVVRCTRSDKRDCSWI